METDKLESIRQAAARGDRQRAYRLAATLAESDPDNFQAWIWRARLTGSREERLRCLSTVLERRPAHPVARRQLYRALWAELEADSFFNYGGDSDHLYQVHTAGNILVSVPKWRRPPKPSPPPEPGPLHPAWRWLRWAALGLLPAGLGAVFLAPVAAVTAFRAGQVTLEAADKKARGTVLFLASLIWLAGLALAFLLFLYI